MESGLLFLYFQLSVVYAYLMLCSASLHWTKGGSKQTDLRLPGRARAKHNVRGDAAPQMSGTGRRRLFLAIRFGQLILAETAHEAHLSKARNRTRGIVLLPHRPR